MAHTINIVMNSDGSYVINPPFTTFRDDQDITWMLSGSGWNWLITGAIQGVIGIASPPTPYAAWPSTASGPTLNTTTNQYEATMNVTNTGATRIFYKWQFNVVNGTNVVSVDPDIANEPQDGTGGASDDVNPEAAQRKA